MWPNSVVFQIFDDIVWCRHGIESSVRRGPRGQCLHESDSGAAAAAAQTGEADSTPRGARHTYHGNMSAESVLSIQGKRSSGTPVRTENGKEAP